MLDNPVWMDGRIVNGRDAVVHVMTPSLHYGWGAYEGIRFHRMPDRDDTVSLFRAVDHLARFRRSNRVLGIELPYDEAPMMEAIRELIARLGARSGYVRPLSYLRPGTMSIFAQIGEPGLAIGCWEWPDYLVGTENGLAVRTSATVRTGPAQIPPSAKTTGGYLNPALARFAAVRTGAHETIMLNAQGRVAEAAAANVFLVVGDTVVTPPPEEGLLPGVTRDSVITLAHDVGVRPVERPIELAELWTADELFLTGTAMGVRGVTCLDGRPVGSGTVGPVSTLLATAYRDAATGTSHHEHGWSEPVQLESH